jgi:hypothetical protein
MSKKHSKAKPPKTPYGRAMFHPGDDFVVSTITEAFERVTQRDGGHGGVMHAIRVPGMAAPTMYSQRVKGKLSWIVRDRGAEGVQGLIFGSAPLEDVVAGGTFGLGQEAATEFSAAAIHAYRGRGLYPAVLHELRRHIGTPLLSDRVLSAANAIVWNRLGAYDPDIGRFRVNPNMRKLTLRDHRALSSFLLSLRMMEGP